ncbi:hypothetical protein [Novosphingobium chloroacetimidivorans]|uniref:hypothetical protein n=1 Tax=Novosphingobium chloroacetimidivorans TaxID=1428314 RepID=UPI001FEC1FC8|nr:hypothetical protein [Novosphingobium chloroacetimidivorans]
MRLGVDVIDLYYQHRVDPEVPVQETVGAMAGSRRRARFASSVFGGRFRDYPARACGPPYDRAPNRVIPLEPRSRSRDPGHGA